MSVTYATVNGVLVEEHRGGDVTTYVSDTLGSVVKTVDGSGAVTSETTYWPYGEIRTFIGSNPSPWRFCGTLGYLRDTITRLYIQERTLRVDLSRWLTVDLWWPEEFAYQYAYSDPCVYFDTNGSRPKRQEGPKWDPGYWNQPGVIDNNNCYSYACDWPWGIPAPGGKPQPGDKSGGAYDNFPGGNPSCNNIIANAKQDGLIFDIPKGGCKSPSHKVCLYVTTPGDRYHPDYHWYRQDDDGYWSNKPGNTEATRCYPGTNIPITNPDDDANRRGYPKKCGCFCSKGKKR